MEVDTGAAILDRKIPKHSLYIVWLHTETWVAGPLWFNMSVDEVQIVQISDKYWFFGNWKDLLV